MVGITIQLTDNEHKILKERAKNARQSIAQYILSKTIDEEKNLTQEEKKLKEALEGKELVKKLAEELGIIKNRDSIPTNAKTGI